MIKKIEKVKTYFKRTALNKLVASGLLICAGVAAQFDTDITGSVLLSMIAIPLLFANENWIDL